MPALIEVKYFNSFVLKKTINASDVVWNGSTGNPNAKGGYPQSATTDDNQWAIEESRIKYSRIYHAITSNSSICFFFN